MNTETVPTDLPADVVDLLGPVGVSEFNAAPAWSKPDLITWVQKLHDQDDQEFFWTAASAIHGSALVNSFRGNFNHEHCKGTAAYREAKRRHLSAGHTDDCYGDTIYGRAFAQVWREQGHDPAAYPPKPCTCGVA